MQNNNQDQYWIQQAVQLAVDSVTQNGGPFGAVIIKDCKIIGRGNNQVTCNSDPSAHAEIMAIRSACQHLNHFSLDGCTLYTSCEPCPMCLAAIYWARISRVVYAASSNDAAQAGFDDAFIAQELCLPHPQKTLVVEQCPCDNRNQSFEAWHAQADKTPY